MARNRKIDTNVPIMPRSDEKTAQIAYNIIGKPSNLIKHKSSKVKNIVNKSGGYNELERSVPVRVPIK